MYSIKHRRIIWYYIHCLKRGRTLMVVRLQKIDFQCLGDWFNWLFDIIFYTSVLIIQCSLMYDSSWESGRWWRTFVSTLSLSLLRNHKNYTDSVVRMYSSESLLWWEYDHLLSKVLTASSSTLLKRTENYINLVKLIFTSGLY